MTNSPQAISPTEAYSRLIDAFARRGWTDSGELPRHVVDMSKESGGVVRQSDVTRLQIRRFATVNGVGVDTIQQVIVNLFSGLWIDWDHGESNRIGTYAHGDGNIILSGNVSGNVQIGGEKSLQIQNLPPITAEIESQLRAVAADDRQIQEVLASDHDAEKKTRSVSERLAKVAGVTLETALVVAVKLVAEYAT